jgi:hypothetical protein
MQNLIWGNYFNPPLLDQKLEIRCLFGMKSTREHDAQAATWF